LPGGWQLIATKDGRHWLTVSADGKQIFMQDPFTGGLLYAAPGYDWAVILPWDANIVPLRQTWLKNGWRSVQPGNIVHYIPPAGWKPPTVFPSRGPFQALPFQRLKLLMDRYPVRRVPKKISIPPLPQVPRRGKPLIPKGIERPNPLPKPLRFPGFNPFRPVERVDPPVPGMPGGKTPFLPINVTEVQPPFIYWDMDEYGGESGKVGPGRGLGFQLRLTPLENPFAPLSGGGSWRLPKEDDVDRALDQFIRGIIGK
jgi:hypothetical protein